MRRIFVTSHFFNYKMINMHFLTKLSMKGELVYLIVLLTDDASSL